MSEELKNDKNIIIEGETALWTLNSEGPIKGTYQGQFRFKCFLSPMERIIANRSYRELLGINPTSAGDDESLLAYALTTLKQRVIQSPPFWDANGNPGDIVDQNIITEVLDAAIASELLYRQTLKDRKRNALLRAKEQAEKMLKQENELEDDSEDQA